MASFVHTDLPQHQGRGPRKYYEPENEEPNIHLREVNAYRRLQEHRLDERGIIPHFFGSIFALDPKLCQPHLDKYLGEEYLPNAIFLEYIPNMEKIDLHNYTDKRLDALAEGLREIHKALVFHGDVKARNMIVFKDDPNRAMWIDFDNAVTFEEDKLRDRDRRCLRSEELGLLGMKETMVS